MFWYIIIQLYSKIKGNDYQFLLIINYNVLLCEFAAQKSSLRGRRKIVESVNGDSLEEINDIFRNDTMFNEENKSPLIFLIQIIECGKTNEVKNKVVAS